MSIMQVQRISSTFPRSLPVTNRISQIRISSLSPTLPSIFNPSLYHNYRLVHTLLQPHLDLKYVRDNIQYIEHNIQQRKSPGDAQLVRTLYDEYGQLQAQVDNIRHERNKLSSSTTLSLSEKQVLGKDLKIKLTNIEEKIKIIKQQLDHAALQLPCDTHPDAPIGPEANAKEILTINTLPTYDNFFPKDHVSLANYLQIADFEAGALISGAGFSVLKNDGVLLEFALVQYALQKIIQAGFTPILPPDLAQLSLIEACGFNPRDTSNTVLSQVYSINNSPLGLIGTAEIPLAGLHAGQLMEATALPRLYGGYSHCFRHEAGGGGIATRGLYRLHQFSKVEMFAFIAPDADASSFLQNIQEPQLIKALIHQPTLHTNQATQKTSKTHNGPISPSLASEIMFARIVDLQISIVKELGLHARVLDMPTEELGASAYRKVDIEAWMPGRRKIGANETERLGTFGEITSASNCLDYQSRRLNIRYRAGQKDNRFIHTLNGTAAAIPRLIIAILETHQQKNGTVKIPECLQKFMGKAILEPPIKK